jgi:MoxR-like ATPase
MKFPYIDGSAREQPGAPLELPVPERGRQLDPAGYLLEPALADAINVALLLSQPLLLTGEPGTGKTQLAQRLAWQLGYGEPLVFNTKSTSTARDLFYTFDTMGRFHAAQAREGSLAAIDYLRFNALGLAILRSRPREEVAALLPPGAAHEGPKRSVVLVDEIDKAPRDFPNDLLHEVDAMSFRVPEAGNAEVSAAAALRPVLVLTSNSERNLPDAFLRRCIFYNIPFPDRERLAQILQTRLPLLRDGASALLDSALDLFLELRLSGLRKPPSTAELINWLQALAGFGAARDKPLRASPEALRRSASTLAKTQDDAAEVASRLEAWLAR